MTRRLWALLMGVILVVGLTTPAQAILIDMGDGTIYDQDRQLSWLQDANYASTSGYDADGLMTWSQAMTWADNLVFAGFTDWRLPTALNADATGPCAGFNCSGSELGHLFYSELGGTAGNSILTSGDPDLALFRNLQGAFYWSWTPVYISAWYFNFGLG